MLQKLSKIFSSDDYGILISKIIHNFRKNKFSVKLFNFIRVVFLKKKIKTKKIKFKSILIRVKFFFKKIDNSYISSFKNSNLFLKKRLSLFGRYIYGFSLFNLKMKKFSNSFTTLI